MVDNLPLAKADLPAAKDLFKPREEKSALPKAQDLFRPAGAQALPKAQDLFKPKAAPKPVETPDEFPSVSEIGSYVWEHNIVSDLWTGAKRVYEEAHDPVAAAQKLKDAAASIAKTANETSFEDITKGLKALGEEVWAHPKRTLGTLVKEGLAHPEMVLLPESAGARAAAMGTRVASGLAGAETLARTLPAAARGIAEITTGAATGAGIEAAEQFRTGNYDLNAIENAAKFNLGLSAAQVGLGAGLRRLRGVKPAPVRDTRYPAGGKQPLEVMTEIGGKDVVQAPPVEAGKVRLYVEPHTSAAGTTSLTHWDLVKSRPKTGGRQRYVDVGKDELKTFEVSAHNTYKVKKEDFEARVSPVSDIATHEAEHIGNVKSDLQRNPEKIIPFLVKNAPAAVATGAIFAGLGLMLTDKPAKDSIFGATALGLTGGLFSLVNRRVSGNKAITAAIADVLGQNRVFGLRASIMNTAANAAVGQSGLERIFKSYDPSNKIRLTPGEVAVKGIYEKSIDAVLNAAAKEGIKLDLFLGRLPIRVVTKEGLKVGGKELPKKNLESFKDLEQFLAQGDLELKTNSMDQVFDFVNNDLMSKVSNKRFVRALEDYVDPSTGKKLVVKGGGPYPDYRAIPDAPGYSGYLFHKDIHAAMEHMLVPGGFKSNWANAMLAAASAVKRSSVSYSLFHVKTLVDGMIGAGGIRSIGKALRDGQEAALGKGNQEVIELLVRKGLTFGNTANELDVDAANRMVMWLGKQVDRVVPGEIGTKFAHKLAEFNHANDAFTFGYVQNGFKINRALSIFEERLAAGMDREAAAEIAAKASNDFFGGQDWFRTMNSSYNAVIRNFGNKMASGSGLGAMRILMFAPDWKFSTFRSVYKAFPGVSEKGEQVIYAKYLLKSAIYYATLGDAVNYLVTGHHFWENHDPSRIEIGKTARGYPTSMHFSKHFMELPDFSKEPLKWMLSAVNPALKAPFEALLNVQYLSPSGSQPIVGESDSTSEAIQHVFGKFFQPFIPISMQQAEDPLRALAGFYGMPISGRTEEKETELRSKMRQEQKAKRALGHMHRGEDTLNKQAIQRILGYFQ